MRKLTPYTRERLQKMIDAKAEVTAEKLWVVFDNYATDLEVYWENGFMSQKEENLVHHNMEICWEAMRILMIMKEEEV